MNIPILIPVYNEQATIGQLVKECRRYSDSIYVVNDGSRDRSAQIAQDEGAIIITHSKNEGKGASLRDGFQEILKEDFKALITMDGDGQHDPLEIPKFIQKFQETNADLILGNRIDRKTMPFIRRIANRFMSRLISSMVGQRIPDTQSGFRLIKTKILKNINLETSNFEIESELIMKASRMGCRIISIPISTIYRRERSKIKPIIDTWRFLRLVINPVRNSDENLFQNLEGLSHLRVISNGRKDGISQG